MKIDVKLNTWAIWLFVIGLLVIGSAIVQILLAPNEARWIYMAAMVDRVRWGLICIGASVLLFIINSVMKGD